MVKWIHWPSEGGFTLLEVLAVAGLVASIGILATGAATSMARWSRVARDRSTAMALAQERLEFLTAARPSQRTSGTTPTTVAGREFRSTWIVRPHTPALGVDRLEVSVAWQSPEPSSLTLVSLARSSREVEELP